MLYFAVALWWRLGQFNAVNYPHFVSVTQEDADGRTQHYVVHTHDPKLAVKFTAETVEGKVKPGTIKRIAVPNSWAGEYAQYTKLVGQAERFFRATLCGEGPAPSRLTPPTTG